MIATLIFAIATSAFAQDPQTAAIGSMHTESHISVVRVNRAGPYAAVLTHGGVMESNPVREPIIVEKFPFGWQALAAMSSTCDVVWLRERVGEAEANALMRAMPVIERYAKCIPPQNDRGAAADVVAVRQLVRRPLVPRVTIANDWALASWYGAGAGEMLFRRTLGTWTFVIGGGGAMDVRYLRSHGVALRDACALHAFDPHRACP